MKIAFLVFRGGLFTVIVPGGITFWIPLALARAHIASVRLGAAFLVAAGTGLVLAGVVVYLWCTWSLAVEGQGTPAFYDAPVVLVQSGPYGIVRHPMYIGMALVLVGESAIIASLTLLGYALVTCTCFHLYVIAVEEPMLRERFGTAYEEYCHAVPRWLPRTESIGS